MLNAIKGFFERPGKMPADFKAATSGLTEADRAALLEDMRHGDALEPGLGDDLARYVITGAPETVVLRLEALLKTSRDAVLERMAVEPYFHAPYGTSSEEEQKLQAIWKRRTAPRAHMMLTPEGWDESAMLRFAQIVLSVDTHSHYRHGSGGKLPDILKGYFELVDRFGSQRDIRDLVTGRLARTGPLMAERMLGLIARFDLPPARFLEVLYPNGAYERWRGKSVWLELPDLVDVLRRQPEIVGEGLEFLDAKARQDLMREVLRLGLARDGEGSQAYRDIAFRVAGDGSAVVRQAAVAVLREIGIGPIRHRIDAALAEKKPADRKPAVMLLAALGTDEARDVLAAHQPNETSKPLIKEIESALLLGETLQSAGPAEATERPEDGPQGYYTFDGRLIAAPPTDESDVPSVPADLEEEFRAVFAHSDAAARAEHDALPPPDPQSKQTRKKYESPFRAEDPALVMTILRGESIDDRSKRHVRYLLQDPFPWNLSKSRKSYQQALRRIWARPDVSLEALTRVGIVTSNDYDHYQYLVLSWLCEHYTASQDLLERVERLNHGADLRRVFAEIERRGIDLRQALETILEKGYILHAGDQQLENPTIWAAFIPYLDILTKQLERGKASRYDERYESNTLQLLGLFPELPGRLLAPVLSRAFDSDRQIKARARLLLGGLPGLTPILARSLADGKAKMRMDVARWLGERGETDAVEPLKNAVAKEGDVSAKAAMIAALARLGYDVSEYFSRGPLIKEAEAGLAKTKVDYSELFDVDNLPTLHWADGETVDPLVVKWWFARSHKLKQPGGDPLLHMAMERLRRSDAEAIGRSVFTAWIAFDTQRASAEEADAIAARDAPQRAASMQRFYKDYTEADAYAQIRSEVLNKLAFSAQPHRGLLALTRFMPPVEMARIGRRYLKDFGKRSNQARSILEAMAANPEPAVIQALLDVSKRHRQPGGRRLAGELVDRIAEDKEWTREELADRVVPTAGVDETGRLDLSFGERAYFAQLVPDKKADLALQLFNPDGKPVSALPSIKASDAPPPKPRGEDGDPDGDEDEDEATQLKAAKATLSASRKELKETIVNQKARLFDAMCVERRWPVEDFQAFVLDHPVLKRLAERLVFEGRGTKGEIVTLFRPMEDGSLTDVGDEPVDLSGFAEISIAHRMTAGEEAAKAWTEHFDDYEVVPLFSQFSRIAPTFEGEDANLTAITDRRGHMIEALKLRSVADRLGWRRGSVEDGGAFTAYERHFPARKMAAIIDFSGDFIGAEADFAPNAALDQLRFVPMRGEDALAYSKDIVLGSVPKVMLAEALGDYHAMAQAGTGFDADWEKKVW